MIPPATLHIVLGIFTFIGCLVASLILKKYEQPWMSWFVLSLVALCLTFYIYFNSVVFSAQTAQKLFTVSMVLFALVAFVQFWSMMKFTQ